MSSTMRGCSRVDGSSVRGATSAVLSLDEAARRRGLVTVSTGNHGRAVAHAARMDFANIVRLDAVLLQTDHIGNFQLCETGPAHGPQVARFHTLRMQVDQFLGRKLAPSALANTHQEAARDAMLFQLDNFVHRQAAITRGDHGGQEGTPFFKPGARPVIEPAIGREGDRHPSR